MTLLNNKGYILKIFFQEAEIFANYCKKEQRNLLKTILFLRNNGCTV